MRLLLCMELLLLIPCCLLWWHVLKQLPIAIKSGKTGAAFKEIQKYLADVEPLAAAAIAVKLTFDKVFSYKRKSNQAVNVCESIGLAVEQECQMRHYEKHAPGLLHVTQR